MLENSIKEREAGGLGRGLFQKRDNGGTKAADSKASSVSIDLDAEGADPEKADSRTDWEVLKCTIKKWHLSHGYEAG